MTLEILWARKSYRNGAAALVAYVGLTLSFWIAMYVRVLHADRSYVVLGTFDKLRLFEYFLHESFVAMAAGALLLNRRLASRIAFLVLFTAFQLLNALQFLSFYFSHDFLIRDALGNTGDANMLVSPRSVFFLAVPLFMTALFFLLPAASRGMPSRRPSERLTLPAVLLGVALLVHSVLGGIAAQRATLASLQANRLYHRSPALAAADLMRDYLSPRHPVELAEQDVERARRYGFPYDRASGFPLIKDWIYRAPLPYPPSDAHGPPNVIVIFAESLSARRIGAYGATAKGISPNIDHFARDNLQVVNYYNHTAATYRGIRGQLCSYYPTFCGVGGWDDEAEKIPNVKVHGLPAIFAELGYRTAFMGSTPAEQAKMESQVTSLGFGEALFRETVLAKYLVGESPRSQGRYLSDHQLFRALRAFLEKRATRSSAPLFLCLWNIETHAGFEVASDGRRYAEGANPVLDTMFNFDHAFGEFLEYFEHSPFYGNTLLILTADHAHMVTKEFLEIAGPGYAASFIDQIPLLVHDPFDVLPKVLDAKQATSLDLAPSLLHLLRVPNRRNHFMGRSLFEREAEASVAYYGIYFFTIDRDGVHDYLKGAMDGSIQRSLRQFIRHTQQLEVDNHLWNAW